MASNSNINSNGAGQLADASKTDVNSSMVQADVTSHVSSGYLDGERKEPGEVQTQVVNKIISGPVIIEGYLKKLKKYLMSNKNYYRVVGKTMLVASSPKKQFTEKYDLSNY